MVTKEVFLESYNKNRFRELTGLDVEFVQDNHSRSQQGVLRGLHYQVHRSQGKLGRVSQGEVYDVAVALRKSSRTFSDWVGFDLSSENFRQAWIPEGFAHGFLVLSETAECLYKTTDYYAPEHERSILWNDKTINIEWPAQHITVQLSNKDKAGSAFLEAEYFE